MPSGYDRECCPSTYRKWFVVQVLVLFHVLHSSAWYAPAHLLPFSQRMHEKAGEGRAALGSQRTVKLASFERAVKVLNPQTYHLHGTAPSAAGFVMTYLSMASI